MEPAVSGVFVFCAAVGAHDERRHGRPPAIVRGSDDDRQPRAAIRAVEKRVAKPPVGRVEQLREALLAGGHVGRDIDGAGSVVLADLDAEPVLALGRPLFPRQVLDLCQGRRLVGEIRQETLERGRFPLDLDQDASGLVPHEAGQVAVRGEVEHERAESDALDDASHHDRPAFHEVDPMRRVQPAPKATGKVGMADIPIVTAALSRDQSLSMAPGFKVLLLLSGTLATVACGG